MANKTDTDRLASELLAALQNVLNKPLPGTGQEKPQSQVDEPSLLDTIKDFLTQSLPGTKEIEEQPSQPPVLSGSPKPVAAQEEFEPEPDDMDEVDKEEWFILKDRQSQEREELHRRHELEREAMQKRHQDEREGMKFRRERDRDDFKQRQERDREAHKQAQERGKRGRGHGRGRG